MIKLRDELGENNKSIREIDEMHRTKENIYFLLCIKCLKSVLKHFSKNYVYNVIDEEKKLWLRNNDMGKILGIQNIYDLVDKETKDKCETNDATKKQMRKYKRHGSNLIDAGKIVYTHEDVIMPIIMNCRVSTTAAIQFRSKLGFKQHDIILSKEQSVISEIEKLFSNEKILRQHSVLSYKIDLYFPEHKLALEVDEKGHTDRYKGKETERQETIEKNLVIHLLELMLIKRIMMSIVNLVKQSIILLNQMKNQIRSLYWTIFQKIY